MRRGREPRSLCRGGSCTRCAPLRRLENPELLHGKLSQRRLWPRRCAPPRANPRRRNAWCPCCPVARPLGSAAASTTRWTRAGGELTPICRRCRTSTARCLPSPSPSWSAGRERDGGGGRGLLASGAAPRSPGCSAAAAATVAAGRCAHYATRAATCWASRNVAIVCVYRSCAQSLQLQYHKNKSSESATAPLVFTPQSSERERKTRQTNRATTIR